MIIFDDADDAVTYAPEIQSVEIPPDQLSENENSLNLVDVFSEHYETPINIKSNENNINLKQPSIQSTNISNNVVSEVELSLSVKSINDTSNKNIDYFHETNQKRPSAPILFSLNNLYQQKQLPKKVPKFLRRNIRVFDDSESISTTSTTTSKSLHKQVSLMSALGVTSTQEMLLKLTSLNELSEAMRKAGLESTNLIFGIDFTASNKYQGEYSFYGRSLHSLSNDPRLENPYQSVIKIMSRTLSPFADPNHPEIPAFGFGDLTTGDWSVFELNNESGKPCKHLDELLKVYNEVTSTIELSGPTNFAPLIYRAIGICQKLQRYHILVIIADGQVTNERATRKAIVHACQYPLSIIVVGVGDGPWDMMKVFDESLPKRPWDNFHFVEYNEIVDSTSNANSIQDDYDSKALAFAIHSLLEIPDQYNYINKIGLIPSSINNKEKSQTPN